MGRERHIFALGMGYYAALSLAFLAPFWLPNNAALDIALLAATVLASLALGFATNVWRAGWLATLVVAAALTADLLWRVGVIDRSDEREPLEMIVVVLMVPWLVPAVAALIVLGVAVRRLATPRPSPDPEAPPPGATG